MSVKEATKMFNVWLAFHVLAVTFCASSITGAKQFWFGLCPVWSMQTVQWKMLFVHEYIRFVMNGEHKLVCVQDQMPCNRSYNVNLGLSRSFMQLTQAE